jgi:hypothetical protein
VGSHHPGRLSRVNGSHGSNGTETIGFYGEEEVKPREFAADAPFTARSSQSDASAGLEAKQNVEVEPEVVASLERYKFVGEALILVIYIFCRLNSSLKSCSNGDICSKSRGFNESRFFSRPVMQSWNIMYVLW